MNGAGFLFNHLFGYGVMDAGSLVDAALSWKVCLGDIVSILKFFNSKFLFEPNHQVTRCSARVTPPLPRIIEGTECCFAVFQSKTETLSSYDLQEVSRTQ